MDCSALSLKFLRSANYRHLQLSMSLLPCTTLPPPLFPHFHLSASIPAQWRNPRGRHSNHCSRACVLAYMHAGVHACVCARAACVHTSVRLLKAVAPHDGKCVPTSDYQHLQIPPSAVSHPCAFVHTRACANACARTCTPPQHTRARARARMHSHGPSSSYSAGAMRALVSG